MASKREKPIMKKLSITKEAFNKSRYFKNKYGSLKYVSESGDLFKTSKGKILKFKESSRESIGGDEYQKDLLEKIGDYLMTDYGVDDVEEYKFGPRITFDFKGKRFYVEVGYTDNQPDEDELDDPWETGKINTDDDGFPIMESINWRGVTSKPSDIDPDKTVLTRTCPFCGKPHSIEVDTRDLEDGMAMYDRGAMMQDAFPNLTPDEREFFMTGMCPKCWDEM